MEGGVSASSPRETLLLATHLSDIYVCGAGAILDLHISRPVPEPLNPANSHRHHITNKEDIPKGRVRWTIEVHVVKFIDL